MFNIYNILKLIETLWLCILELDSKMIDKEPKVQADRPWAMFHIHRQVSYRAKIKTKLRVLSFTAHAFKVKGDRRRKGKGWKKEEAGKKLNLF